MERRDSLRGVVAESGSASHRSVKVDWLNWFCFGSGRAFDPEKELTRAARAFLNARPAAWRVVGSDDSFASSAARVCMYACYEESTASPRFCAVLTKLSRAAASSC